MNKPFWVLEDTRCAKWSPTPQYLHKDAPFYGAWPRNWGAPGGGMVLHTPNVHDARKFEAEVQARNFMAECGRNIGFPDSWAVVDHCYVADVCERCGGSGEVTHPEGGPQYPCHECRSAAVA